MKVLVTGFGPFKDFDINPSALLVEKLEMDDIIIRKEVFDVNRVDIEERYPNILDKFQPDFILNIGLSASSGGLNLETFAINSLKDKAIFSTITQEWGYQSKLDTSELADMLCKDGIPAIRSDYAGSYYCNFIYFLSLEWCDHNKGDALFLHIPFTNDLASEISLNKKVIYPSLPTETMLKGIKKIITHLEKKSTIS
jgi:pyroglutamyl-peptidase